jgi:hypothetical protein
MATPVSILFTAYRSKYSFGLGGYRPRLDPELVSDQNRLDALYAGAGLGATGLALRGIPNKTLERVGATVMKATPLAVLGTLGAGVAMDKSLIDADPLRVAIGTGLAGAGTGLMLRGLENSLSSVIRPGAGNLLLKAAPLMALTAGGVAYARKRKDDLGQIF